MYDIHICIYICIYDIYDIDNIKEYIIIYLYIFIFYNRRDFWYVRREILLVLPAVIITGKIGGNYYWLGRAVNITGKVGGNYYWLGRR